MSTMKRFRPTRSFSTAVGGPNAARRESGLVFGKSQKKSTASAGPMVALPGSPKSAAGVPVRVEMPEPKSLAGLGTQAPAAREVDGVQVERNDTLPAGTMRVTYADGTTALLPAPKR